MRRQRLISHLLLNLLHRRRLHLDRPVRVPSRHFQKPARHHVQDVAVRVGLPDPAALAGRFHVRGQGGGGAEEAHAF